MNLIRCFVDVVNALDLGIDAYMVLPGDWEPRVSGGGEFLAQIHIDEGAEELAEGETQMRVNLYGNGIQKTLDRADALKDRLCWDRFGSSYHFTPSGQMLDDVEVHDIPMPVPQALDRVSLATATYIITNRDR